MIDKPLGMLTLDVEDWEHANFAQVEGREIEFAQTQKDRNYAMDANTDRWIEILAASQAQSTCFVLGEFALRYPAAVKRLAQAGHEIASHGPTHDLIYKMSQTRFREFLKAGMGILGDLLGSAPIGFRAPSWSVDERTPWFCEELKAQGLKYDSSEFPIRTPLFGQKGASLVPHVQSGIFRVPVTVLTVGPARFPFASGAFFRLAPLPLIRFGLKQAYRQDRPVMIVLHPRELDPAHPRLPLQGWEASVHYARLDSTVPKLQAVLNDYQWLSIQNRFRSQLDTLSRA